jgi:N utilization substance protein B
MSRRKARVLAFQALYWYEAAHPAIEELIGFHWEGSGVDEIDTDNLVLARHLVAGTIENLAAIDSVISANLVIGNMARVRRADLALIRVSVYSLLYQKETPPGIIIEEAIGIARRYCGDNAFKFVNGILDAIRRKSVASAA